MQNNFVGNFIFIIFAHMEWEKEANQILRQRAIECGLCNQWQEEWGSDWSAEKLVERFFAGIDFYAQTRFFDKNKVKDLFGTEFLRKHNVLIDDKWSLLSPKRAALIGQSATTLRYGMRNVSEAYLFDNSSALITCKTNATAIIHLYDNASAVAKAYDAGRVLVIRHGVNTRARVEGNASVEDEMD